MKKITAIILSVLMLMGTVCVSADTPAFLSQVMTNYTADYDASISFDNSAEVVALLNEAELPEEVSYFVDLEALLRTLLSFEGKMNVQVDMSEDYKKMKMAFTADSDHNVEVNQNLTVGVDAKMGMWMNMDLTDEANPVYDIVYQQPFMNKYMKIGTADAPEEASSLEMLTAMFNKEYMDELQKMSTDLFMKYAKINGKGNKYTIEMDNEGFASYINEILLMTFEMITVMSPETGYEDILEMPSVEGWQFLGEDGLKMDITLSGGKIKTQKLTADISIDLAAICESLFGIKWEYESAGLIDFTITMAADVTNIGRTKVKFPELNDENCITLSDLYPDVEAPKPEEYPLWYVGEYCDYLPEIDGEIYIPLRQTIEAAYAHTASIDFDNGTITIESDKFDNCKTMVIAIDSNDISLDGTMYKIKKPVLIDGRTYVSSSFFTDVFRWEFGYASHNLITDEYQYTFYTQTY